MGETFTGRFVLDTSEAQTQANNLEQKVDTVDRKMATSRHNLATYFELAMHMANIWANTIEHQLQGTKAAADLQIIQQSLNIASAEMSVALTIKRGLADIAAGSYVSGTAQLILATSMQGILGEMVTLRAQQESAAQEAAQVQAYWKAYT